MAAETSPLADVCFTANTGRAHCRRAPQSWPARQRPLVRASTASRRVRRAPAIFRADAYATTPAGGGVSLHGAGIAVRGDGTAAVRDAADVPAGAGALRRSAAGRLERPLLSVLYPAAGRELSAGRDGLHAAGAVRGGVRAGELWRSRGDRAGGGAGAQRGRVRGGVRGGGLQPGGRPEADRGARAADAGVAARRGDGGGVRGRGAGEGGDRRDAGCRSRR